MNLAELSKTPQLIEIAIDKKELVEKYGDQLIFYVYDRQPLDVFAKLANADKSNMVGVTDLIKDMILDKDGNKIVEGDKVLPLDVMIEAVTLITDRLGK